MTKTWITSDPHFGHANVIKYEDRPFADIDEMEKILISNWNKRVRKHDKVIVAGDFSFHNKAENQRILKQLNGHKILILGNHDRRKSRGWWLDAGFDQVIEHPILLDDFYIISHEPVYLDVMTAYVNVHGHTHSHRIGKPNHFNVSVELHGYCPIDFEEIKSLYIPLKQVGGVDDETK